MELTVPKKDLLKLVTRMQGVAERKSTMPVLSNVLLAVDGPSALRMAATDLYLALVGQSDGRREQGRKRRCICQGFARAGADDARGAHSLGYPGQRDDDAQSGGQRGDGTRCEGCQGMTPFLRYRPRPKARPRSPSMSTSCKSSSRRRTSPYRRTRPEPT